MSTPWNNDSVRALERSSIRAFMERNRGRLKGRVLDFGCGQQPYRDLVDGEYIPFEKGDVERQPLLIAGFDAVMCNQVLQYIADPAKLIGWFYDALRSGGHLVLTGPTNWAEVEEIDLQRFTLAGIRRLLTSAGFAVLSLESRAGLDLNGFKLSLGYGAIAQRS